MVEDLRAEARERVAAFGLRLIGEPETIVADVLTITVDDPRWHEEFGWGPSLAIFVEVHVQNPFENTTS